MEFKDSKIRFIYIQGLEKIAVILRQVLVQFLPKLLQVKLKRIWTHDIRSDVLDQNYEIFFEGMILVSSNTTFVTLPNDSVGLLGWRIERLNVTIIIQS